MNVHLMEFYDEYDKSRTIIMKEKVEIIVNRYLEMFPNEKERLSVLENFLEKSKGAELTDWNNANGHLTVGAFVYCKEEDKFLVLYHKDLKMYLYPGGHVDKNDKDLLDASRRELKEETGLENLEVWMTDDEALPFDIDTHIIPFNERVGMAEHYHFDVRYLFLTNKISDVVLDEAECGDYKWVSSTELSMDKNFGNIVVKAKNILDINNRG